MKAPLDPFRKSAQQAGGRPDGVVPARKDARLHDIDLALNRSP
jgi:hypothetical protein